ncbi:MAG: alkaline phosphatase family protein, partial [Chloroflexota bacterium]|nr:alkaline phosphatase family protein [Chloroflexota bacterium]
MADLLLGPLLRYVGEHEATVWVETDAPCEVEVLGRGTRTFRIGTHHYALVCIDGLEPGSTTAYEVRLDGERKWPQANDPFPDPVIRTLDPDATIRVAFGSCRVAAPHHPPFSRRKDDDPQGREIDALYALALRMRDEASERWPHLILMLGDQIYADETSPGTQDFIRSRRDPSQPPGLEVADFEEYSRLYYESWQNPAIRWLLSTVSSAMIFDDHDVHDDWNTSAAWVAEYRRQPWWNERIVGAFSSYWLYQHIGNLSPRELSEDEVFCAVRDAQDGQPTLDEFSLRADRETAGARWSFCRDLGRSKLVMIDSRAGRVLEGDQRRCMVDDAEWQWIDGHANGDFDHLLLGTSLPFLLGRGMHYLEAWNEAVCAGAWGSAAARLGEKVRQGIDLEHWSAFGESFRKLADLIEAVGAGRRGEPPASIVVLSGDVHHAYLAEVAFRRSENVQSAVYQATCSPFRNPLNRREEATVRFATSWPAHLLARALAKS